MDIIRSTNHTPWALVIWGGLEIGKRPRTKLAYLPNVSVSPRWTKYRGSVIDNQTGQPKKTIRSFLPGEVVQMWCVEPSNEMVKAAKEKLHPVDKYGCFTNP